ncbi:Maf-like protein [Polaribacter dokdonensis]|uniref:dTTP/UTP pyrophosphatase n=1 Tax=Polaribacter dokdonensis DSW-5 TaxID=1300348 RepID=A0A0N0CFY5_9FLAO|nr:Maf-like protein [Polaribacter dokdonensis]KOY52578.1 Maf-like protein [Polaribacter dokdonensis DSW-5]SEE48291.1 septum formation protein [Polaribacter dokdonensis DSW-5]
MLREKLKNYTIILASGSPRRQQFLKDLDIDFIINTKSVDEIYPLHLKGAEITDFLADLKSKAFTELNDNDVLITSDTIVWHKEKALGKPKDRDDAIKMLQSLSNKTHEVITSISIKTKHTQKIINDTTLVSFKKLTDEEINYYIDTYKPYDKAGAYGIQEWIGFIGINKIEGSYYNVAGLPVHKLYDELLQL